MKRDEADTPERAETAETKTPQADPEATTESTEINAGESGTRKRPDQVVYDEEKGYNAALLPYASSVGAPAIRLENIAVWKQQGTHMVNKVLKAKFMELEEQYRHLVEEHRWNELVYSAEFNFEPVIGQVYHLYDRGGKPGKPFLSMIAPNEWGRKRRESQQMGYIGSFYLDPNRKWIKRSEAGS